MKDEIINALSSFDKDIYNKLYIALSTDIRFEAFKCYSHSVDSWYTFKNSDLPINIYNLLCNKFKCKPSINERVLYELICK